MCINNGTVSVFSDMMNGDGNGNHPHSILGRKMKNWQLYQLKTQYDNSVDDYMLDACTPTDTIVQLKEKPSQEAICKILNICRKIHKANVSKNDIYIVKKKSNEPVLCLKILANSSLSDVGADEDTTQ